LVSSTSSEFFPCPSNVDFFSRCTCQTSTGRYFGFELACRGLNDEEISSILKAIPPIGIDTQSISLGYYIPLVELLVTKSETKALTRIPGEIVNFPSLRLIDFSSNQITSIPPGAFSFSCLQGIKIYLQNNQITSISSGAFSFTTTAKEIYINLGSINVESISSGAFQGK